MLTDVSTVLLSVACRSSEGGLTATNVGPTASVDSRARVG